MARRDLEGPIHKAVLGYLRWIFPDVQIVHHSAGEGVRGGKQGKIDGGRRKAMGQIAGFPDLMVLPYASLGPLFFEVKAEGGVLSDAQKAVHERLRHLGYRVAVVRSIDDVRETLREWSIPTRHVEGVE